MKDIYDYLNEIDVDADEFEEMDVTDFEKMKLKKQLKNKMRQGNQHKWKRKLTAISIALSVMLSGIIGLSFTASADGIPFIGDLFKYFDKEGVFD
ncbi:MAG: DUF4179 domain-containing protein, partial [Bacillaceae bacterium]